MQLKEDAFCALATSAAWQAWLYEYDQALYTELAAQLRAKSSCKANAAKMMELLSRINLMGGASDLETFLRKHFPYVLREEPKARPVGSPLELFNHFDPSLLTFPRRLVLMGSDLEAKVRQQMAGWPVADFVILGNKAYIEYLPAEYAHLAAKIPAQNWKTKQFKLLNQNR